MTKSSLKMAVITAHAGAECFKQAVASWGHQHSVYSMSGTEGMLPAYQQGFEATEGYDVLAYLHDDVIINDPHWGETVLREFEDPAVGLVGFGGATGHGDPDLYKKPYDYRQLGRSNFMSNMPNAEDHGIRFTESCDVAVLDGYALIVRRNLLAAAGGWPLDTPIGYACYDYWLCCMMRRMGKTIRMCGIDAHHLGGQTFVKLGLGRDAKHWDQYLAGHRYIFDSFADCLPWEIQR